MPKGAVFQVFAPGASLSARANLSRIPAMFRDAFQKLDRLEIENLMGAVNPLLDGAPFNPRTVTVLAAELSFYPGWRLLDLADHEVVPARRVHVLYNPEASQPLRILDWTNAPIYALNRAAPLTLKDDRAVVDYVRFFFAYVRGRHGRFIIAENVDDIAWKEDPPQAARKAIGNLLEPVRMTGESKDGTKTLVVRMIFKDSLFRSTVLVSPDGMVSLTDEELVVEDMPVVDDLLGQ